VKQLGPYRLLEELGRGGMGVVWRAEDTRSGRIVALKTLLEDTAQDLEFVERFRREGALVRGIHHPNLVEVLGQSLQPPVPYVVFEFVAGETLQARVEREGPLRPLVAAGVVSEIAAGVAAAHERGLLHRDIKPENVLLGPGGAKLTDFGLVKDLEEDSWRQGMTQSGVALGTPSFMAPEQGEAAKDRYGEPTDVYGLAATLYFALTGQPPFSGPSAIATLIAVRQQPPPSPRALNPDVPAWLDAVCVRGMAKLGSERYPSAVALRAALQQGGAPGRRAPWVLLALSLGLAATAGAVLSWVWEDGASEPDPPPPPHAVELTPSRPPLVEPEANPEPEGTEEPSVDAKVAELMEEFSGSLERKDDAAAAEVLRRVFELAPGNAQALAARAALAAREGRFEDALQDLEAALERDPSYGKAYAVRGQIHANRGELEAAERSFGRAIELADPSEVEIHELHYARGMCFDMLKRKGEAAEAFGRAIELKPDEGYYYLARGKCYLDLGRYEEALADVDAARARGRTDSVLSLGRAKALIGLRRYEEALAALEPLRAGRAEVPALQARAEANAGLERYEEALHDLGLALRQDARSAALWLQRGKLLNQMQRYADALSDLERGLASVPTAYVGRYERAVALSGLQRYEEALAELEWVLANVPDDQQILGKVGLSFRELNRSERGVAASTKALELGPVAPLHVLRGECLLDLGRVEEALADCDAAIRLDGDMAGAYASRAAALRRLARPREALAALKAALRLGGAERPLLLQCAEVLSELGRYEEAAGVLDRAVELMPGAALPRLRRGIVRLQLGRHQAAVEDLDRFLREQPDNGVALVNHAQALTALGRTDEALRDLDRALEQDERAEYYATRGAVRLRRVELRESLSDLSRAIELGTEASTYVNRASCLLKLFDSGEFADALTQARADLERALALDPRLADAYRVSSQLHRRYGEFAAGVRDLDRVLELQPATSGVLIERGGMKAALDDDAGARADYDRALALEPSVRGFLARGRLSRSQGKCEEALADYARAQALEPDNATVEAARGSALEGLGRLREALAAYRRAFDLGLSGGEAVVPRLAIARIEKQLAE